MKKKTAAMEEICPKCLKVHPKTKKCEPKSSDSWLYENAFDRYREDNLVLLLLCNSENSKKI